LRGGFVKNYQLAESMMAALCRNGESIKSPLEGEVIDRMWRVLRGDDEIAAMAVWKDE